MATHNGAATLPRVLERYTALQMPQGGWKLVIVDNASSDATPEIVARFSRLLPIRYVHEARRGKNIALNAGLPQAEGELLVFTDDDAIPESDWLQRLFESAQRNPGFAMFGGSIKPMWERQPPQWILDAVPLAIAFGLTDPQLPEGPISPGLIWGANLAVRSEVFEKGFRFNETIGPAGKRYAMGGETEFTLRLHEAGFRSWFCPQAVVYHIIRKNQLKTGWILDRAYKFGRSMHRLRDKSAESPVPRVLGIPRWLIRRYVEECVRVVSMTFRGQHAHAFKARWELHYLHGFFYETFANRRRL
jgi:glycosyltransferase involved in cell wall biosynthesis